MSLPPTLKASVNDTGFEWTPGSRSSGKMTCSRARFWACSLASSSSSTVAAREAALASPWCVSVNAIPPTRDSGSHRWRERTGFARCATAPHDTVGPVTRRDLDAAARDFAERGWVVVDAVSPGAKAQLADWADEVAALPDSSG